METLVKASWIFLGSLHLPPALALLHPSLLHRLYGIPAQGELGVLMAHRGALFAVLVMLAAWALWEPSSRPPAAAAMALSILGFLAVYCRAGLPQGPLTKIALADLIALAPLALVCYQAWWSREG